MCIFNIVKAIMNFQKHFYNHLRYLITKGTHFHQQKETVNFASFIAEILLKYSIWISRTFLFKFIDVSVSRNQALTVFNSIYSNKNIFPLKFKSLISVNKQLVAIIIVWTLVIKILNQKTLDCSLIQRRHFFFNAAISPVILKY